VPSERNALRWTSADVLSDVRRKASLPATSTDWTDAVILREATDVLWSFAGWALSQAGDGRLLSSIDRPITTALMLTGTYGAANEVPVPPLAIASTIEGVSYVDSSGQAHTRLTRIDQAEEATWAQPTRTGTPACYALVGERIRLYPTPNQGGTLRVTYQRRHPELLIDGVAYGINNVSAATAATSTTTTLTESYPHSTYYGFGDLMDVISGYYPYAPIASGLEILAFPTGSSVTVNAPVSVFGATLEYGARLVRAGQSPYVSYPLELRTCISEKIAANILRTMGDMAGMQAAEQSASIELSRVIQMLTPRSKRDKPRAVNPYSHLRLKLGRW
jgi:hypothetical protein